MKSSNDGTVQTTVKGLEADERHYYRFCGSGVCSPTGKFTTAPKPKANETIRFAYTGDTDATREPGRPSRSSGTSRCSRRCATRRTTSTSTSATRSTPTRRSAGCPRACRGGEWEKYRLNISEPNLYRLRKSGGFYSHWDDHEFINDFSIPEDGEQLYRAGVKAFRNYAPVTYTDEEGLYRTFRWGKNLELFFLDQRSFRSAKADFGGACDIPGTDDPDLAPTAPQSTRNAFAPFIPSLANPVSQQCKNIINDPARTMLGEPQFDRFINVDSSPARWKIVVNETDPAVLRPPVRPLGGIRVRAHSVAQRAQQRGVGNVVFITTDTHAAFANIIRPRTLANDVAPSNAPSGPRDTQYRDFIIGPVGTNPFWDEIDGILGTSGTGEALSAAFFKPIHPTASDCCAPRAEC